jgi:transposase
MKMFIEADAIYLHLQPVDFRKAIDGLAMIVETEMQLSPFSGALFVFCNKGKDKLKVLYWDTCGFCLWQKRLEKDKFKWPTKQAWATSLSEQQWHWLLAGFDITKMQGHQRLNYEGLNQSL